MMPRRRPSTVAPKLAKRPLMEVGQAKHLAEVFQVLACVTRLRMLHALLKAQELGVTDLAQQLDLKPQAVSNQLQQLASLGIVANRREGTHIYYRVVDRCVSGLLEQGWCLVEAHPDCCQEGDSCAPR